MTGDGCSRVYVRRVPTLSNSGIVFTAFPVASCRCSCSTFSEKNWSDLTAVWLPAATLRGFNLSSSPLLQHLDCLYCPGCPPIISSSPRWCSRLKLALRRGTSEQTLVVLRLLIALLVIQSSPRGHKGSLIAASCVMLQSRLWDCPRINQTVLYNNMSWSHFHRMKPKRRWNA